MSKLYDLILRRDTVSWIEGRLAEKISQRDRKRLEAELIAARLSFWKRVMEWGVIPDYNGGLKKFYLEDYEHFIRRHAPSLLE